MDIIKKLNELRLERNMSVYRLAEVSGINQSTLANTFSRGTIPSISNLEAMCEGLGITLSQFFSSNEGTILMTQKEIEIFKKYKKLPPDLKEIVEDLISSYSNLINDQKNSF